MTSPSLLRLPAVLRLCVVIACCIWLLLTTSAKAETPGNLVRIAAASDLRDALTAVSQQFQQHHPDSQLELVFGSSGKLQQQIMHGAPFDLYLAADLSYANNLWQQGFALQAPVVIGKGHLVLVTRAGLAAATLLSDLQSARFRFIAIAEPQHAPYGDRARQSMKNSGLWQQLAPKIVYGENVAKTFALVQSGAADAALVALSLLKKPGNKPKFPVIDSSLHQPLQAALLKLKHAQTPQAAQFYHYLQSAQAQALLQQYGFSAP